MTVNELVIEFKEYSLYSFKEKTNLARFSLLDNYIIPFFSEKDINKLTHVDINNFFDFLSNTRLSQNTIFGIYSCLLSIFKYARENNYIANSPMNNSNKVRRDV